MLSLIRQVKSDMFNRNYYLKENPKNIYAMLRAKISSNSLQQIATKCMKLKLILEPLEIEKI